MTDETIESRPGVPVGAILFFIIALALGGLALALAIGKEKAAPHVAVGVILPFAIGVALLLARPRHFVARLTETSLEVSLPEPMSIPYDSLEGLWAKKRSSDLRKPGPYSYPINVIHQEGVLKIPGKLNLPSDDVYLFLFKRFPPEGERGVHPKLREYLEEQHQTFGPDRVFSYRARNHLGFSGLFGRGRAVSLAVVAGGIGWMACGGVMRQDAWLGAGLLVILFGLLFFLLFTTANAGSRRIKNWRQASMVISPLGLALVQGDLVGEMRWDELQDVNLHSRYKTLQYDSSATGIPGINLKFEGASITIPDIYDQPLWVIYQRIRGYWK